jgi:hypothetical protein
MLDLNAVFDADAVEAAVAAMYGEVKVEDLPGDWRVWFEERAAIMEYDGGLPRERAEAEALTEIVGLMRTAERQARSQ